MPKDSKRSRRATAFVVIPTGARITEVVHVNGKRRINYVTRKGKPGTVTA